MTYVKKPVIFLFLCLFLSGVVLAEHQKDWSSDKKMALSVNVGTLAFGFFEATYYLKLSKKVTLTLPVSWYDFRLAGQRLFSKGYTPFIGYGAQIHFLGEALCGGMYVAPAFNIGYVVHPTDTIQSNGNLLSRIGANFGFDYVWKSGVMIDMNAGVEHYYMFGRLGDPKIVGTDGKRGFFRPVFKVALGYSW